MISENVDPQIQLRRYDYVICFNILLFYAAEKYIVRAITTIISTRKSLHCSVPLNDQWQIARRPLKTLIKDFMWMVHDGPFKQLKNTTLTCLACGWFMFNTAYRCCVFILVDANVLAGACLSKQSKLKQFSEYLLYVWCVSVFFFQ